MFHITAKAFICVWTVTCLGCTLNAEKPGETSEASAPNHESRAALADHDATISVETTSETTGIVEGTVHFTGETIPTSTMVPVGADPDVCGHLHSKEDYVIDEDGRGIRYVIIHLKGKQLRKWPQAKPQHLVLDNKNCRFEPHAAVLTIGSTVELRNSDKVFHTTHAYFGESFNYGLSRETSVKHVFEVPGLTQIRCDRHGWMNSFIRVDRHPFHAVTDASGQFKISDVPPGKYTLAAWHEQFGPQEIPIVVQAGETKTLPLTYPVPSETHSSD